MARRDPHQDLLHICVKDEPHQLVYALIPLGGFLSVSEPEARIDKQAHLHVLYQNVPRSFCYFHVDTQGKVVERAVYSDFFSKPRLVLDVGIVSVRGGELVYPKPERVMADSEVNPPPPPPPPKPKKKWWWPFGPKTPSSSQ